VINAEDPNSGRGPRAVGLITHRRLIDWAEIMGNSSCRCRSEYTRRYFVQLATASSQSLARGWFLPMKLPEVSVPP
jgi:hypothetical protein